MLTKEELLARAQKPSEDAMKLHPFYRGKIEVVAKCVVRDFQDFGIWYTPGVAAPCRAIAKDKELAYDYTNKWNSVAVVTDGTRVLGLGDIGPEAAMPVMEGKALLFKYLGGVDAVPICLDTKDPDQFIATVKLLQPSFGGINLEDISQPKCFRILNTLRREMHIPVWHDDQQGTAAVTLAGLINALEVVGKSLSEARIAMIGAGAANLCIARLLIPAGVTPGHIIMCDSKGTLHRGRTELKEKYAEKWEMCLKTNEDAVTGGSVEAIRGADVLIALSTPGPGTVKPEWVAEMAADAVVFACANPVPEIWPWEAKEAGARIMATGRSDFPNQVNNSLGFPGIFRGTLDVRARTITDEMCIAAAYELAKTAQDRGLHEEYLVPTMDEWEVFPREAVAVGLKAIEQGVARVEAGRDELYEQASRIIERARGEIQLLMDEGIIPPPPEE
ncbi:MAG TPA: NADP-dependent malic enzyme [Anaerolineae bacterium]|nr:NADP-dependent malic enzyme [Anaerolineae bacterium]